MFWRAETLEKKLPRLIEPYDPRAIDCAAYTLHVGNEIYVSPDQEIENADRHTMRKLADGECFAIPPGQFAFSPDKGRRRRARRRDSLSVDQGSH